MVILFLICFLLDNPPYSLLKQFHDGEIQMSQSVQLAMASAEALFSGYLATLTVDPRGFQV